MNLAKIRCEKCKFFKPIYIHPWSKGVDKELLRTDNGFACLCEDERVSVSIGRKAGIGCEMFVEASPSSEGEATT